MAHSGRKAKEVYVSATSAQMDNCTEKTQILQRTDISVIKKLQKFDTKKTSSIPKQLKPKYTRCWHCVH